MLLSLLDNVEDKILRLHSKIKARRLKWKVETIKWADGKAVHSILDTKTTLHNMESLDLHALSINR